MMRLYQGQCSSPDRNKNSDNIHKRKTSLEEICKNDKINSNCFKHIIKREIETSVTSKGSNCDHDLFYENKDLDFCEESIHTKSSNYCQERDSPNNPFVDNSVTLHNQSDISDEGRLVIADFSKNEPDMNINHNIEDSDDDLSIDCSTEMTTDLGRLNKNNFADCPTSKNFDLINQQKFKMSSTMNNNSCHSRLSTESNDSLPIQAEVVMSEGSEDEGEINTDFQYVFTEAENKYKDKSEDTFIEYIPTNLEMTAKCNIDDWQLNTSHIPPYAPTVALPEWMKSLSLEEYLCESCGDKFNLENSFVEHKERQSILVTFDCDHCQEKLVFHNRCAFKDHIRQHRSKNEYVNETNVVIKPLHLEHMKLLQPIKINKYKQNTDIENQYRHGEAEKSISSEEIAKLDLIPTEWITNNRLTENTAQCYICKEGFNNDKQLISHLKTDLPWSDEKVECKKCRLVLPSLCSGKAHILIHSSSPNELAICPECGKQYSNQSDFVCHLNDCGHQFRKSGIVCPQCNVCFFHFVDDFLSHWISEHCSKYFQCFMCGVKLNSTTSHNCKFANPQMPDNFNYILNCPLCSSKFNRGNPDERDLRIQIKKHLNMKHSSMVNRVHYVFKSKFCLNAFKTKEQLYLHHEEGHRKNNSYQSKNCVLLEKVQGYLKKYFDGVQERNSFVILNLLPTLPQTLHTSVDSNKREKLVKTVKADEKNSDFMEMVEKKISQKLTKETLLSYDKLKPVHCYQCAYVYSSMKDFKRHCKICKRAVVSLRCDTCNTNVKKENFPKHCVSHLNDNLYVCMFCSGRQFESKLHLDTHFELHAKGQFIYPLKCIFCDFKMVDSESGHRHVINKHEVDSTKLAHECSNCQRKFHGSKGLMVHMKKCSVVISSNRPILIGKSCNLCKRSIQPEVFNKHMISHLEDGNLICILCDGWLFESRSSLLHHLEEHSLSLKYPYECSLCTFTMTDSNSALRHLKDEYGFNKVKCPECDMSYTFMFMLQRHINIVHKVCTFVKRRYICWLCKAYDHVRKESVINHFKLSHSLSLEEVNEQTDIRTRGFGTLPSTFFIPIKALGKKESPPKTEFKYVTPKVLYLGKCKSGKISPYSRINNKNIIIKQEKPDDDVNHYENLYTNSQSFFEEQDNSVGIVRTSEKRDGISIPQSISDFGTTFQLESCLQEMQTDGTSPLTEIKKEYISNYKEESPYKGIKIKFGFQNKDKKLVNNTKVVLKRMNKECNKIETPHKLNESDNIKSNEECQEVETPDLKKTDIIKSNEVERSKLKKSDIIKINKTSNDVKRSNLKKSDIIRSKEACKELKKSEINKSKFKCKKCKFWTYRQSKFDKHIISHDQDVNTVECFFCEECGESFVVKPSLDRHRFFVHRIKQKNQINQESKKSVGKFKRSRSADETSSNRKKVKRRLSEACKIAGKSFHCNVCKEKFSTSSALYTHLKTHGMAFLKMGQKRRSILGSKS